MTETERLAEFYWDLFAALHKKGFDEDQALKICLKEARVPRDKGKEKKTDVNKILKKLEEKAKE